MWAAVAIAAYQLYQNEQGANDQEAALAAKRAQAKRNAKYMMEDAWAVEGFGQAQEAFYDPTATQTLAQQTAIFAANDVDSSFGTAADIQADTKVVSMLTKIQMRKDANQRATGLRRDAADVLRGADIDYRQGMGVVDAKRNAGYADAVTSGMQTYSRYGTKA